MGISGAGDGTTLDSFGRPKTSAILEIVPSSLALEFTKGAEALPVPVKLRNGGGFDLILESVSIDPPSDSTWLGIVALDTTRLVLRSGDSTVFTLNLGNPDLDVGNLSSSLKAVWMSDEPEAGQEATNAPITVEVVEDILLFEPTLSKISSYLLNPYCTECHAGNGAPKNLKLDGSNQFSNLVNVPSDEKPELMRVKPFSPDDSYLIHKLEGGPDIIGKRMPRNGPPFLSSDQVKVIRRWIQNGAQDN